MTTKLVPRLNSKYSIGDAIYSTISLFKKSVDHSELVNLFDNESIYFFNHARTGMRIALSALNLPPGTGVGVMTFNCLTVLNSIKKAGYIPVFIDVTNDLQFDCRDLKRKSDRFKVLIVNHMFGIPNNIHQIRQVVSDIPIIEDCAHSFYSYHNNKLTGTFGDFATFSYGRGKFPSISDGGYLLVNNSKYSKNVEDFTNELAKPTLKQEIFNIAKSYFLSLLHKPIIYKNLTIPFLKETDNQKDLVGKYGQHESLSFISNKALFLKVISKINHKAEYQKEVGKKLRNSVPPEKLAYKHDYNFFMLPVYIDNRKTFIEFCIKRGIEIGPHFSNSIKWALSNGYQMGECINAEKIAKKIVAIPCHYNLNKSQVELLMNTISEYLDEENI